MPHCIIEYAQDIEGDVAPQVMIEQVLKACVASQLFHLDDIKLRALPYTCYQIGDKKRPFLHVDVKMLSGRSPEQKLALSQAVLGALSELALTQVETTVEISDTDRESYSKYRPSKPA